MLVIHDMALDPRTPFDSVPEAFDRWRPRYCDELFDCVAARAALGPGRRSLEIGPGTGQATGFALRTGADCTAIELGANLANDWIRPDCREPFFGGIRAAIERHGGALEVVGAYILYLWTKDA